MAYEKVAEIKQATNKITSETISILVTGKYVILAFHNNGSCSTLFSVKVTYNVCPEETLGSSLMTLPRTVAPANDSQPIRVEGNCIKDAVQVSGSLFAHCESNGEWNTTGLKGKCICKEDMENNGGICQGMMHLPVTVAENVHEILVEVKYFIFYFLGWVLFPLSFRNIEATLSLSSEPFFSRRFGKTNLYSFTLVSNISKNTNRNH